MSKNWDVVRKGGILPQIGQGGHDSYGGESYSRNPSRLDNIESRLNEQERTSHNLIEQAYRVKEDIMKNMNYSQGSWQEEKYNRELVKEHIKTITDIVKRLSRDIKVLEDQIRARESMATGATSAVKNLEMHHVAGLTDVRSRIARADAAIARLIADTKATSDAIKGIQQQQQDHQNRVLEKLQSLENKISEMNNRLDKSHTDQELKIRHMEGDSTNQLSALDNKTRSLMEEMKMAIKSSRALEEGEREKLEMRIITVMEKAFIQRDGRVDKLEQTHSEQLVTAFSKVRRLEEEMNMNKEKMQKMQKDSEKKLNQSMEAGLRKQTEEIARLKNECREGFSVVHESINNMKTVVDGRRKLLEDQLRKEIGQVRKMVVLI